MRVSIKKWVGYNLWMNWKGQSKEWCWMMFGLCLDHHWCWDDNPKCLGYVYSLAIVWLRQLPLALAVASWTRAEVSCSAWWSVQAAHRYHKPGPEAHILDETKPLGTGAIWKQLSIYHLSSVFLDENCASRFILFLLANRYFQDYAYSKCQKPI